MTTTIYLIRHGKTQANKENRFAGRTDESLHPDGVRQLTEIKEKIKDIAVNVIYAGPLQRTRQSAAIVARESSTKLYSEEGFIDINLPHWDGLTKDEIRWRFGAEYPTWLESPDKFYVKGCESLLDVQKRAVRAVERISREQAGKTVLLVTHLIVARCLLLHYRGQPMADFRSVKVDNGEVVKLTQN